eukprot:scaffold8905_cov105-Isochrysis_galbana.AAC.1
MLHPLLRRPVVLAVHPMEATMLLRVPRHGRWRTARYQGRGSFVLPGPGFPLSVPRETHLCGRGVAPGALAGKASCKIVGLARPFPLAGDAPRNFGWGARGA